jgi:putative nucleotidyltransferase with HDIG domain
MDERRSSFPPQTLELGVKHVTLDQNVNRKRLDTALEGHRCKLGKDVSERIQLLQAALRSVEYSYDQTLEALAAALDLQDSGTAGHSRRVTRYCLEIAKAMGCDPAEQRTMARAALLHDIGKIGIPDAIMLKPGPLTEKERLVMESHVEIGFYLLSNVALLASPAEIVFAHHERFDGGGYPRGLRGAEMPLGARIFTVADTLDAMTSNRPYRRALPYEATREEILSESGHQFDPQVVAAFATIGEATWDAIREGIEPRSVLRRRG